MVEFEIFGKAVSFSWLLYAGLGYVLYLFLADNYAVFSPPAAVTASEIMPIILSELNIMLAGKLTFTLLIAKVWLASSKLYSAETPFSATLPELPFRSMPKPANLPFREL